MSILSQFFCDKAIKDEHYYGHNKVTFKIFTFDCSQNKQTFLFKTYQAPEKDVDFTTMIEYIDNLPEDDDPSLFGMNTFAEKMLLAKRAEHLVTSILSMEPLQAASSRIQLVLFYFSDI